jgi:ACS family D-galactonate transporter-like MFS transporter
MATTELRTGTNVVPRPKPLHWVALGLLVLSVCINYVDRGNLGVAAKSIEGELHFSQSQLGVLLGGFFWTYSFCQLAAGYMMDRWNVNWLYAAGFAIWSVATGITGFASSFVVIMLLRLVLGAGESIAYPAYSKIIATTFPESLRGTANALIDSGSKVGPALGILIGVKMIQALSWRLMFFAVGAASLLWLLPWCLVVARLPRHEAVQQSTQPSPSLVQLLTSRAFWGTVLGLFGGNYTWYLFLTWLPYYFETDRHYTKDHLAIFGSLPFWTVAVASMSFGLAADALIRRGWHAGRVRKTFVSFGLLGCCMFIIPAVLIREEWISTVFFVLGCICLAGFSSNHWAYSQTLAGVRGAGKWTGFENCLGNLSGVIAPFVSGATLHATKSFIPAFIVAGIVLLIGAFGFSFVVGVPEEVDWGKPETS